MRNGQHHHDHHSNKSANFLPMFCRLSLHDVKPHHHYTIPLAGDPISPRVSCIGQVKRNNRVIGFPTPGGHHRHRKPVSVKTVPPNAALGGIVSCRPNFRRVTRVKDDRNYDRDCSRVLDVAEMDPPLPVARRSAAAPEASLWKRRGKNGGEIGRLQIEDIKLGNNGRFRFQTSPTTA